MNKFSVLCFFAVHSLVAASYKLVSGHSGFGGCVNQKYVSEEFQTVGKHRQKKIMQKNKRKR